MHLQLTLAKYSSTTITSCLCGGIPPMDPNRCACTANVEFNEQNCKYKYKFKCKCKTQAQAHTQKSSHVTSHDVVTDPNVTL